ncbi:TonB-dependent receptor [Helicobacter sp. MIT 14-3879]|uniref:TonB-dependent receptor n=1 Tax=Helicobacter sp. MIT 14-3879 TaxID=2040649 RepID=UPI000E1F1515|nr:TonB-dependent receptor [Helicobacter sp. MIT 14-3879]RDU65126.1 hemin uptake system outer membrane receptor [Helicobacter sp. MIT 14-3879]
MNIKFKILLIILLIKVTMATENKSYKNLEEVYIGESVVSILGFDLPIKNGASLLIQKNSLESKGYHSLEQALIYQPLITFSNKGFGNNIDLRGQGEDANRAVKILLNRVPISLLDTSHGVAAYNSVDIDDIESIEIIPGGGAVVYGSGTRGGVVNIVTKKPSKNFARAILKLSSGEKLGLQSGSLSLAGGGKVSDKIFLRGDFSGGYIGGVRNAKGIASDKSTINAFRNDNSTNLFGAFQAYYDINENHKLDFNISYGHSYINTPISYLEFTKTQGNSRNTSVITKNNKELKDEWNNPGDYKYKNNIDFLATSLNYKGKISNEISLDAIAFYQFSNLKYIDYEYCLSTKATEAFNCPAGIMNMGGGSGFFNQGGGANVKFKYDILNNSLVVGLDNILESSNRLNYINHIFPTRINNANNTNILQYISNVRNKATKLSNSLYIYNTYKPIDFFDLGVGARVEYSNYYISNVQDYWQKTNTLENTEYNKFYTHTSRLGYATEIAPNFYYSSTGNVYLRTELGFISPSAFQMINADPNSSINSNNTGNLNNIELNHVKPEQYVTAEIGLKDNIDFNDISFNIFYTHTFNEIYVNNITHGTSYTYGNLGQTQRLGVELVAGHSLFNNRLRFQEGISYIYSNIFKANESNANLKNTYIPYVPWLKITFAINGEVYRDDTQNIELFMNNAYFSSSIDTNKHIMNKGGYLLSDLGVNYNIQNYKISVGVKNLFNYFYATYQKYPQYQPAMGRSYYLELRYAY